MGTDVITLAVSSDKLSSSYDLYLLRYVPYSKTEKVIDVKNIGLGDPIWVWMWVTTQAVSSDHLSSSYDL